MSILYPVFAMAALTLFCVTRMGLIRYAAVRRGEIDGRFYRLYRDGEEPEHMRVLTRHVVNLYEAPVLFYTISIIAFITQTVSTLILILSWTYVALRYLHSYVHLSTNRVINRFRVFVASHVVLMVLWIFVLISLPH